MPKKNIIEIHNLGELKLLAKKIHKMLCENGAMSSIGFEIT